MIQILMRHAWVEAARRTLDVLVRSLQASRGRQFLALTVLFLAYSVLALPAHHDDIGVISTGVNLLRHGAYRELTQASSHRGPLASALNGAVFLLTGSVTWTRNVITALSAAALGLGLVYLARRLFGQPPGLVLVVYCLFPFFPFILMYSSIHLPQAACFVWSVNLAWAGGNPSLRRALLLGVVTAASVLCHSFNLFIASVDAQKRP